MTGLPSASSAGAPSLEYGIEIGEADIDHMGHVNNAIYLKWVQAAVVAHWERFAPVDRLRQLLWVALRHEITYRRPAFLDDILVASTAIEAVEGAKAFYRTVVSRGGTMLAEVRSVWCCIDATTRRPVRIAQDIVQAFAPHQQATDA